jgi:hypothetical protein
VGRRQVLDVNVVTQAGAVGSAKVLTEDREWTAATQRRVERQRDEMRLGIMSLAD